jgi:hypothetical protein
VLGLIGGVVVFGTACCVYGFLYYYKKAKEIWGEVKGPFWKGWEGVKWPFKKGKEAWVRRRERKAMEKRERLERGEIERNKDWLDTLELDDKERELAESVREKLEDIVKDEEKRRIKTWRLATRQARKIQKDEDRVEYSRRYKELADSLGLSVEEGKVLEKMREAVLEWMRREGRKRKWFSGGERREMERKEKARKGHKEWLGTLKLTEGERKIAEKEVVVDGMLEMIEREGKTIILTWNLRVPKRDENGKVIKTSHTIMYTSEKGEGEKRRRYDVWVNELGLNAEGRRVLQKLKEPTQERIIKEAFAKTL